MSAVPATTPERVPQLDMFNHPSREPLVAELPSREYRGAQRGSEVFSKFLCTSIVYVCVVAESSAVTTISTRVVPRPSTPSDSSPSDVWQKSEMAAISISWLSALPTATPLIVIVATGTPSTRDVTLGTRAIFCTE